MIPFLLTSSFIFVGSFAMLVGIRIGRKMQKKEDDEQQAYLHDDDDIYA
jgi:hypothetical protein